MLAETSWCLEVMKADRDSLSLNSLVGQAFPIVSSKSNPFNSLHVGIHLQKYKSIVKVRMQISR